LHAAKLSRQETLAEVEAAMRAFGEHGDDAGLARALALRGRLRFWGGDFAGALEDLEEGAMHAQTAGDRYQEVECLQYVIAVAVYGATPARDGLVLIEEIQTRVDGNRRLDVAVLNGLARLQSMRGDFVGARDALQRSTALLEGGSEVTSYSHVAIAAGMIELLADDAVAAEGELRPACERLEAMGELGYLASAAPQLLEALYRQGRFDEALALSDRWRADRLTAAEDLDAQVGWRAMRAKLLAHAGHLAEAEALAREADALCAGTEDLELRARALADLADVLRLAGRPHESRVALEEAGQLHERKGNLPAAERVRRRLDDLVVPD